MIAHGGAQDAGIVGNRDIIEKVDDAIGEFPTVVGIAIHIVIPNGGDHHAIHAPQFGMARYPAGRLCLSVADKVYQDVMHEMMAWTQNIEAAIILVEDRIDPGRVHHAIGGSQGCIVGEQCADQIALPIVDIEAIASDELPDLRLRLQPRNPVRQIHHITLPRLFPAAQA